MKTLGDRFTLIEALGAGGYGSVFKAKDRANSKVVALKQVKFFDPAMGLPPSFIRENAAGQHLKHENIVDYGGVYRCKEGLFIILECCDTTLESLIGNAPLEPSQVKKLTRNILEGLSCVHQNGYTHRDLNTSNILIKDGNAKIADFGLCKILNKDRPNTSNVITLPYKPPELLLGATNYDSSVDMWCVGCILFEMMTGKKLFKPRNPTDAAQLKAILNVVGTLSTSLASLPGAALLPKKSFSDEDSNCGYQFNENGYLSQPLIDGLSEPPSPLREEDSFELSAVGNATLNAFLEKHLTGPFADARSLIAGLLCTDPTKRFTVDDALEHPFVAEEEFELDDFVSPILIPEPPQRKAFVMHQQRPLLVSGLRPAPLPLVAF